MTYVLLKTSFDWASKIGGTKKKRNLRVSRQSNVLISSHSEQANKQLKPGENYHKVTPVGDEIIVQHSNKQSIDHHIRYIFQFFIHSAFRLLEWHFSSINSFVRVLDFFYQFYLFVYLNECIICVCAVTGTVVVQIVTNVMQMQTNAVKELARFIFCMYIWVTAFVHIYSQYMWTCLFVLTHNCVQINTICH